jgi:Sulfotransferase family
VVSLGPAKLPGFFIIGAPESGSNLILSYLKTHPRIFCPPLIDSHFFAPDLPGLVRISDTREYYHLFQGCPCNAIAAEASIWYLLSEVAVSRILEANPHARLVVLLRNPIDTAYALHSHFVRFGHERVSDFEEAWHLQLDRRRERLLPAHPEPRCVQYREVCSVAPKIRKLLDWVPHPQLKIVIFEEFLQNPWLCYRDLLYFLGLEERGDPAFLTAMSDDQLLVTLVSETSASKDGVSPLVRLIADHFGSRSFRGRGRPPVVCISPPPIRPKFRRYLAAEFSSHVGALEALLGRPISVWRKHDWFSPISVEGSSECPGTLEPALEPPSARPQQRWRLPTRGDEVGQPLDLGRAT